jgi:hypothetical protein
VGRAEDHRGRDVSRRAARASTVEFRHPFQAFHAPSFRQGVHALGTVEKRVEDFNQKNKKLSPILEYAKNRGLQLATSDGEKLVKVLSSGGEPKPLTSGLTGRRRCARTSRR